MSYICPNLLDKGKDRMLGDMLFFQDADSLEHRPRICNIYSPKIHAQTSASPIGIILLIDTILIRVSVINYKQIDRISYALKAMHIYYNLTWFHVSV